VFIGGGDWGEKNYKSKRETVNEATGLQKIVGVMANGSLQNKPPHCIYCFCTREKAWLLLKMDPWPTHP